MNPDFINPLVLAYLGDSVLELLVRDYLVKESELKKVNELCQEATPVSYTHLDVYKRQEYHFF